MVGHKEQNIRIFYLRDVIPLKKKKTYQKKYRASFSGQKDLNWWYMAPLINTLSKFTKKISVYISALFCLLTSAM